MYNRNIKFQYYTMWSKILKDKQWVDNGEFHFVRWLKEFNEKYEKRAVTFDGIKARIEDFAYDEQNNMWAVRFMKMRDTNIPSKVKENEAAEVIKLDDDEYIGEDVSLLYHVDSGIVMIQSNRMALGVSKIERFIDNTPVIQDEQIDIRPIGECFDSRFFTRKKNYRSIEVTFANLQHMVPTDGKTSFGTIMKSFNKLGGVTGKVVISLGRSKDLSLNRDEMVDAINELRESDNVEIARVKMRDDDDSTVEIIDIFDNICNDIVSFSLEARQTLEFNKAVNGMRKKFVARLPELKDKIGK